MKNIEKIREMDKKELAAFLCNLMCADCCDNRCPARQCCRAGHSGMETWLESEEDNGLDETD